MLFLIKILTPSLHILNAFVCILEIDLVSRVHFSICRPALHPGLDIGHSSNPSRQIGNFRIGGQHPRFQEVLGAEEEKVKIRPGEGVTHHPLATSLLEPLLKLAQHGGVGDLGQLHQLLFGLGIPRLISGVDAILNDVNNFIHLAMVR